MSDTFFNNRNKALAFAGVIVLFALIAAVSFGRGSDEPEATDVAVVEQQPQPAAPVPQAASGWAEGGDSDDWGQSAPDADWSARGSSGDSLEVDIGDAGPDREGGTPSATSRGPSNISSGAARGAPEIIAPGSNGGGGQGTLTIE